MTKKKRIDVKTIYIFRQQKQYKQRILTLMMTSLFTINIHDHNDYIPKYQQYQQWHKYSNITEMKSIPIRGKEPQIKD